MGSRNGGCDRVVGIWLFIVVGWVGLSPMCGIVAVRAQWSLWLVAVGVMAVSKSLCCVVGVRET